jgi:hypothetical protein
MNKLALALSMTLMAAAPMSAQLIQLNTGTTVRTDQRAVDGVWHREGNSNVYVRRHLDVNGNVIVERARLDAAGNYNIFNTRVAKNESARVRNGNDNQVFVRRRVDANGNVILERARRDANGNYVMIDSRVIGTQTIKDKNGNGIDDRTENGKQKDSKWKKDNNGKKWNKELGKAGKGKGRGRGNG